MSRATLPLTAIALVHVPGRRMSRVVTFSVTKRPSSGTKRRRVWIFTFCQRFVVMFEWAWAYTTGHRGARLITGKIDQPR